MRESYLSGLDELLKLPKDVQEKTADRLIGYSEVCVTREYGEYTYFNGCCLQAHYAPDHKCWFFNKETVKKVPELAEIINKGEAEQEEWYKTHDVNWDFWC